MTVFDCDSVQSCIWDCLNHYAYEDAVFLAESYFGHAASDTALFLLATAYYRSGQAVSAYLLLKTHGARTPDAKFLLAKCCMDLEKLSEAEDVLVSDFVLRQSGLAGSKADLLDDSHVAYPFAMNIVGNLCMKTDRHKKATEYFRKSLTANPCLLSSFKAMCTLGQNPGLSAFTASQRKDGVTRGAKGVVRSMFNTPLVRPSLPYITPAPETSKDAPRAIAGAGLAGSAFTPSPGLASLPSDTPQGQQLEPGGLSISSADVDSVTPAGLPGLSGPVSSSSPGSVMKPPKAPRKGGTRRTQEASGLLSRNQQQSPPCCGMIVGGGEVQSAQVLTQNQCPDGLRRSNRLLKMSGVKENARTNGPLMPMSQRNVKAIGKGGTNTTTAMANRRAPGKKSSSSMRSLQRSITAVGEPPRIEDLNAQNIPRGPVPTQEYRSVDLSSGQRMTMRDVAVNTMIGAAELGFTSATAVVPSLTSTYDKSTLTECSYETGANRLLLNGSWSMNPDDLSLDSLMSILKACAEIEAAMIGYDCDRVLKLLQTSLPIGMMETGWYMCMHARAYFEQGNYEMAAEWFARCRESAEYYIRGMELYSTALWHLHREMELSALAQDLTQRFRYAPEGWCAAGNCFSLQKDNETAVRFFERAIQLQPSFAYAYTLLGSEYLELDEIEKARQCYSTAIRHQANNYYAWFGVGNVYCKLGKLELAERYYRKALSINPRNPVLMCHVSVMLQRQQKFGVALQLLNRALSIAPKHALCLYQKAEALFALQRFKESLELLEELKQLVPKESKVYLLAGKVHKKLNQNHLALMHLSWATDLDPRGGVHHPTSASDRHDEEPVTALATMEPEEAPYATLPMESEDAFT